MSIKEKFMPRFKLFQWIPVGIVIPGCILLLGLPEMAAVVFLATLVLPVTAGDLRLKAETAPYTASIVGVVGGVLSFLAGYLLAAFVGFGVATIFVYRLVQSLDWFRKNFDRETRARIDNEKE